MKLYLSGPITGAPEYKRIFGQWAEQLRKCGFEVVNPAEYPDGLEYEQYMDLAFKDIPLCHGLAMMENWDKSPGAIREVAKALYLDIPTRMAEFWVLEGP